MGTIEAEENSEENQNTLASVVWMHAAQYIIINVQCLVENPSGRKVLVLHNYSALYCGKVHLWSPSHTILS